MLKPRLLGSVARSCKVIKEAVKDAKDKLKVKHDAASALLVKCFWTVEQIVARRPTALAWSTKYLTAADAPALTNVLKSKAGRPDGKGPAVLWEVAGVTPTAREVIERDAGCSDAPFASACSHVDGDVADVVHRDDNI